MGEYLPKNPYFFLNQDFVNPYKKTIIGKLTESSLWETKEGKEV